MAQIAVNNATPPPEHSNSASHAEHGHPKSVPTSVSYHDEEHKVFGCSHYARNCFLKASCCDQWYVCRLCHDENNEEHSVLDIMDADAPEIPSPQRSSAHKQHKQHKPHKMNRYSTQFAKCMRCGHEQIAAQHCENEHCGESSGLEAADTADTAMADTDEKGQCPEKTSKGSGESGKYVLGRYFCDVCKFYDDSPSKEIFHCADCGLCRLGKAEDYIHCDKCGCCLNYKYYAKHPCIENSLKSDCPICFTYLFKSRKPVTFWVPCGHPIHYDCLREYGRNGQYLCPVCRSKWYDAEAEQRKKVVDAIKNTHRRDHGDHDDATAQ